MTGAYALAMITGISLVAAGRISWAPSSPDFTRWPPGTASSAAIVRNTVGGAGVVVHNAIERVDAVL